MAKARFRFVDLFAGAGGLTLGFKQAGFEPLFAVEVDPWAARTYKTNFGAHVLDHPIERGTGKAGRLSHRECAGVSEIRSICSLLASVEEAD
jgi:site-specific DNA-cytosine methylase